MSVIYIIFLHTSIRSVLCPWGWYQHCQDSVKSYHLQWLFTIKNMNACSSTIPCKDLGWSGCDSKEGEAVQTRKAYRENRGITPLTLNLTCRCRWVAYWHSLVPLPVGKEPLYPLSRRLVGPVSVWKFWRKKKHAPAHAGNSTPDCPAHSVVNILTVLPWHSLMGSKKNHEQLRQDGQYPN